MRGASRGTPASEQRRRRRTGRGAGRLRLERRGARPRRAVSVAGALGRRRSIARPDRRLSAGQSAAAPAARFNARSSGRWAVKFQLATPLQRREGGAQGTGIWSSGRAKLRRAVEVGGAARAAGLRARRQAARPLESRARGRRATSEARAALCGGPALVQRHGAITPKEAAGARSLPRPPLFFGFSRRST